ncbi:hypothetical protein [Streptomyces sp. NPDC060022]|uniref:scabin-related ADP-ribosyltransferase n=1 Tax=Streptomyces sp. NPDC060022 TaxID=3347039 RepID=UPI0036AC14A8
MDLHLSEVAGVGDRLAEALLHALRHNAPQLATGEPGRELGWDLTGMESAAVEALFTWAGRVVSESDIPRDAPLLERGERVTTSELAASGVELAQQMEMQAVLQGGELSVGDLARVEQFAVLSHRVGGRDGTVSEVVADLIGRRLGFRVALAVRGASDPVRLLGAPEGPSLLLVLEHGRYLPGVPRPVTDARGRDGQAVGAGPKQPQGLAVETPGTVWPSDAEAMRPAGADAGPSPAAPDQGVELRYPARKYWNAPADASSAADYSDIEGYSFYDEDSDDEDSEEFGQIDPSDETTRKEFEEFYFAYDRRVTPAPQPAVGMGSSVFGPPPEKIVTARSEAAKDLKVLYRLDRDPLYRWDSRPPEIVMTKGMMAKGGRLPRSLRLYQNVKHRTAFVSTTRNCDPQDYIPEWRLDQAHIRGFTYRYKIDAPGGIDLLATLNLYSAPNMQEVIFWKGIKPQYIVQVDTFDADLELVSSVTRDDFLKHLGESAGPGSAGPAQGAAPEYPPRAHWNAPEDAIDGPAGTPADDTVGAPQRREILTDGRLTGVALFSRHDWDLRGAAYERLSEVAEYREWSGSGLAGRPTAARRPMPASGSGTFYLAAHGNNENALDDLVSHAITRLLGPEVTHLIVVACTSEGAGTAQWERLQTWAADKRIAISRPTGAVAVVPDADGGSGVPMVHLLEDAQGRPTRWLTLQPAEEFDPATLRPAALPSPSPSPWSVSSWRPSGDAQNVRFASLYADPAWQKLSVKFETNLAQGGLGGDGGREITRAVERLWDFLVQKHGASKAYQAFASAYSAFLPDSDSLEDQDAVSAFREFLSDAPLMSLMAAFAQAVYKSPSDAALIRTMPGQVELPRERQGAALRAGEPALAHSAAGFRYLGGLGGPARTLLRAYQLIGADIEELKQFRDYGVTPWVILTGQQSLHVALRDSHLVGLGDEAERTALSRDGARLHVWARDQRLGGVRGLTVPHHQVYDGKHEIMGVASGDDDSQLVSLVGYLAGILNDVLAGRSTEPVFGARFKDFLDRHGSEGEKSLRALQPSHLNALHLWSRDGFFNLMHSYVRTGRLGAGMVRWVVRRGLITHAFHLLNVAEGESSSVWVQHGAFMRLLDAMEEVIYEGIVKYPHVSWTRSVVMDIMTARPEKITFQLDFLSLARRVLQETTDQILAELSLHSDMITEALELLPPENREVWYGDWVPRWSGEMSQDTPMVFGDILMAPGFRSATSDKSIALTFYAAKSKWKRHTLIRPVLVKIEKATARDISFASATPDEEERLFPPGTAFEIIEHTPESENGTETHPETYTVREMPTRPPRAYYNTPSRLGGKTVDWAAGEPAEAADLTPYQRILPKARHPASSAVPVGQSTEHHVAAPVPERPEARLVWFEGRELELVEVDGAGDRLIEALAHALVRDEPRRLTGNAAADVPGPDLTGPPGSAAEALYRWAAGEATESDIPPDMPLLRAGHQVSLAELNEVGAALAQPLRTQAALQGGVLSVADVGLTGVQQLRLVLGRGGERPGAVNEMVAALLGRVGGFQVVLAESGSPTELRRLGPGTTPLESPSVLLVRDGGRYLAAVLAPTPEPSAPKRDGGQTGEAPGGRG